MTEPTNPLFDDEKEFLERKKLEYERALRGDVEVIKEQTVHVGKLALIGAGVASGIWLLTKAFGGGSKAKPKHKKKHKGKHKPQPGSFEDYAGFDGYADDDHEQELDALANDYHSPEYAYDHADRFAEGEEDGFYSEGGADEADENHAQYEFGEQRRSEAYEDEDDNGLSNYPDFPAHSGSTHGDEAPASQNSRADQGPLDVYHTDEDHGDDEGPAAHSFASPNSYQARPYDDSRRLPVSNSFADFDDEEPTPSTSAQASAAKRLLVPTLVAFAKSETGKVIIAQAAAVAMALAGKVLQDILPSSAPKANKNTDLAASPAAEGASPVAWPATTAAQDAAAAPHNYSLPAREPLA